MISRRLFGLTALAGLWRACTRPVFGGWFGPAVPSLDDVHTRPAGPLVGRTTSDSTTLWMYTPGTATIDVAFGTDLDDPREAEVSEVSTDGLDLDGRVWRIELDGLQAETRYAYRVAIDGEVADTHRGSFRTAPKEGVAGKFRLGVTSCMKIEKPQESWPLFAKQELDLHLTIGDTVYSDSTDPAVQWRHHLRYRQSSPFANVIRSLPTYSMWDDHDYGPNNSDGTAKGKENSLSGWNRVWNNPAAGTDEVPGAFYRFPWADVDFFVVDGRYHRSPDKAPDDASKTMLGDEQFAWLVAGLRKSTAAFKFVVSGSPLHHSMHDGWRIYTHAQHRFLDAIREHRIPGIVYVSGSLHRSLVWEHHESDRAGYPLVEVISSGIANSKRLGFATIDFDTTQDDPTFSVRILNGSGRVTQRATYARSQLSHT